jgi:hypothetical protein
LLAFAVIGLLALGGCIREARVRFEARVVACNTQYPAQIGNYVARANCTNESLRLLALNLGRTEADLADLIIAAKLKLAVMLDQGAISEKDAHLQLARLRHATPELPFFAMYDP